MDVNPLRGLEKVVGCATVMLVLFVPLGLWKLGELVWWLWERIANG